MALLDKDPRQNCTVNDDVGHEHGGAGHDALAMRYNSRKGSEVSSSGNENIKETGRYNIVC